MPDCPLPLDLLPKPLQKHADEKAPVPLRMMGAKGLVPAVAPADLVTLLYVLSFAFEDLSRVRFDAAGNADEDRALAQAMRSSGKVLTGAFLKGDRNALPLAPGQFNAPFPHQGIVTLGHGHNKIMGVGFVGCLNDFCFRCIQTSVADVVPQCPVK